jgi:DNA-binding transcriptional MocR family regulator
VIGSVIRPLTLNELQLLSPDPTQSPVDLDLSLTYGDSQGSLKLRESIARINSSTDIKLGADNVIITPGTIMANYLALTSIIGAGDHVICQYPTFAQLYEIPRIQGAEVSLWKAKRQDNWAPNIEELEAMIRPNTKAIIIRYFRLIPTNKDILLTTLATQTIPPALYYPLRPWSS